MVGLGLHPIPSLCLTEAEFTAVISFRILRLFLALTPHQSLTHPLRLKLPPLPALSLLSSSPTSTSSQPLPSPILKLLILFGMTARRSTTYQIRPPPKEVFPESTLSPGGLQLTTLFWDMGILFHRGSHAGARVGNNFEVFGCIMTRVFFSPL